MVDPTDCMKRQSEVYKGTPRMRCINPEADAFKQLVVLEQCAGCPVRKLRANQPACNGAPKDQTVHLPVLNPHEGYPYCPFRFKGDTSLMCSLTNLPVDREVCGRCDAETREHEATFGEKVVNYFGAVRRWVANGCPTRTQEQIDQLFKDHCSGCDRYDPEKHACKNCGCAVSTDAAPLSNKLAMETEHCPLGRF